MSQNISVHRPRGRCQNMAALLHRIFSRLIFCTLFLPILTSSIANGPGGSGPGGSGGTNPPPANDNFGNRILSSQTSITITGSLSGATIENDEKYTTVSGKPSWYLGTASVWFSWKAPESGLALLLPKTWNHGYISVSAGTNLIAALDTNYLVAEVTFPSYFTPNRYVTFQAEAGTEYQIRILGNDAPEPFEISLALTNLPVILEHPRSRTASPGGNALLTVTAIAFNDRVPTIQWQYAGNNLPGRVGPTLAFTNANFSTAGDYRAVVSSIDQNGITHSRTSNAAHIFVKEPTAPTLNVRRDPKGMYLEIQGDVGRSYILHPALGFSGWGGYFSEEAFSFRLGNWSGTGQIYYLEVREPQSPTCDLNLKRINFAKERFAADKNSGTGEPFNEIDLRLYVTDDLICPEGGVYTFHNLSSTPTCSLGPYPNSHVLESNSIW